MTRNSTACKAIARPEQILAVELSQRSRMVCLYVLMATNTLDSFSEECTGTGSQLS